MTLKTATGTLLAGLMMALPLVASAQRPDDRQDDHRNDQRDNQRPNQGPDQRGGDHRDDGHGYVRHNDWRKGRRMNSNDWSRGQQVDYRSHHLRNPPRGYEWREVDGNYVLAAAATGLIASIIVASTQH